MPEETTFSEIILGSSDPVLGSSDPLLSPPTSSTGNSAPLQPVPPSTPLPGNTGLTGLPQANTTTQTPFGEINTFQFIDQVDQFGAELSAGTATARGFTDLARAEEAFDRNVIGGTNELEYFLQGLPSEQMDMLVELLPELEGTIYDRTTRALALYNTSGDWDLSWVQAGKQVAREFSRVASEMAGKVDKDGKVTMNPRTWGATEWAAFIGLGLAVAQGAVSASSAREERKLIRSERERDREHEERLIELRAATQLEIERERRGGPVNFGTSNVFSGR